MKRKGFSILFALVLVISLTMVAAVPVMAQTTLYVDDDNCPGPGTGTQADPFCTIQDAIDAFSSGDTINVAPGTYAGFTVPNTKAGITILGAQANVDAAGSTDRGIPGDGDESLITGLVKITADYVTLNGFKMTSSYVEVGYTHAYNVNISYNIFENVTAPWGAIHLHGINQADRGYIGYNTISGAVGYGIYTVGNDDVTIEYNQILNLTYPEKYGIAIDCCGYIGTGIVVRNNTIINSDGNGIDYWAGAGGVITDNAITNCNYEAILTDRQATISGNHISGGNSYGIRLWWGADGSTVSGNSISNTAYEGIQSDVPVTITNNDVSGASTGIQLSTHASGSVIEYNNIHHNQYRGLSITDDVTNATVTNNHIANHLYCGVTVWGDGDGSGIHINNNSITGSKWFYGVESMRTDSNVDATNNWWGNPHGPCTPEEDKNPAGKCKGKGDAVSTNVDYEPWLHQPIVPMGSGHGLTP